MLAAILKGPLCSCPVSDYLFILKLNNKKKRGLCYTSAGLRCVLYLPEMQECIVHWAAHSLRTHIRRPTQYSPEQQSFEDLADEQTSALLESWGFARTAAAASE